MNCKVCGKELSENAIFCGNCGSKVEVQNVEPEAVNEAEEVRPEVTEEPVIEETVESAAESEPVQKEAAESEPVQEETETETEPEQAPVQQQPMQDAELKGTVPVEETAATTVPAEDKKTSRAEAKAAKAEAKAAKAEIKAAKAAAKAAKAAAKAEREKYMVRRNPVISSVACIFLSVVATAVILMTSAIAVLCSEEFDDFYYGFIANNRADYDSFWIMTSAWYLYAVATVLLLLILLIFSLLKRRKYAIFNYIGIPMIINGVIFTFVALLNKWIAKTFDLPELLDELFDVIGDEAKNVVLFAGIIMLASGALLVFIYILVSVIHKAVHRKKCIKAENN